MQNFNKNIIIFKKLKRFDFEYQNVVTTVITARISKHFNLALKLRYATKEKSSKIHFKLNLISN